MIMGISPKTDHELLLLINQSISNMKRDIEEIKEHLNTCESDLECRISKTEKWIYTMSGGLAVLIMLVGWILTIVY